MLYKIELCYTYGWDDAEWTIDDDRDSTPWRFRTIGEAQAALDRFFAEVREAVAAGNMDMEKDPEHYRIVAVAE